MSNQKRLQIQGKQEMSTTKASMLRRVITAGPRKTAMEREHNQMESRRCEENTAGPEEEAIAAEVEVRKME